MWRPPIGGVAVVFLPDFEPGQTSLCILLCALVDFEVDLKSAMTVAQQN